MSTCNKCISAELNKAIKMLGDTWVLCIVSMLSEGEMRFTEIQRAIPDSNPATLANRLKKLELAKLLKRKEETVDKISVVYELTDKGRATVPILKEIQVFADKFF